MENGDMLKEIRLDVKSVLQEMAKFHQWIEDHNVITEDQHKRLSNYSIRIRTVELFVAGIIAIPSIIAFLYYIGVIKLFGR